MSAPRETRQIPLDLGHRTALGRADFLVAPENAEAVAWVDAWPDWPAPALVIYGPPASGKTHLLHVWCERTKAPVVQAHDLVVDVVLDLSMCANMLAIDGIDAIAGNQEAEQALFHLYNIVRSNGGALLLTSDKTPGEWRFSLPDLASRLRAAPAAGLNSPGDELLSAVLAKMFSDRQIRIAPDVLAYILPRMERSFEGARALVDLLDRVALAEQRAVTIPLVRSVLVEE